MAKKYPKIFHLGHRENFGIISEQHSELVITEKFDGSNSRFWLDPDTEIHFGTKNVELGPYDKIPDSHQHKEFARFILERVDPADLDPDYTYFGEKLSLKHTIEYDNPPVFVGFDIWVETKAPGWEGDVTHGRFMHYDTVKKVFDRLGLPYAEPIYSGKDKWTPQQLQALIGDSVYGPRMEGIVIKSYERFNKYGRQLFAKIVREEFKEKNKASFGHKKTIGPESDIVQAIYTSVRIRKKVHELLESGRDLEMELMGDLPKMVFEDGIEEEWREIVYIRKPIDFKLVRNLVAKKCVKTLRAMLMEQA